MDSFLELDGWISLTFSDSFYRRGGNVHYSSDSFNVGIAAYIQVIKQILTSTRLNDFCEFNSLFRVIPRT